jgi:hypothetical protein
MSGSEKAKNLEPGMLCKLPYRMWGRKYKDKTLFFLDRGEIYLYLGSERTPRTFGENFWGYYYFFLSGSGEKIIIDHNQDLAQFVRQHVVIMETANEC